MKLLFRLFALYSLLIYAVVASAASDEAVEHNRLGAKLLEQGKADAAILEFQKALRTDPDYLPARLNLAYGYERTAKIDDAIAAYRGTIDSQPRNFLAHNNLGVLLDKKGLYEEAISEFEDALKSEPGNSMVVKNLETAKKNKSATQEREAQVQRAEKEAQAKPNDPNTSYNVARIYAAQGKRDEAQEWLARALKQGYRDFNYIAADPAFEGMREDRDFRLLLNRAKR